MSGLVPYLKSPVIGRGVAAARLGSAISCLYLSLINCLGMPPVPGQAVSWVNIASFRVSKSLDLNRFFTNLTFDSKKRGRIKYSFKLHIGLKFFCCGNDDNLR